MARAANKHVGSAVGRMFFHGNATQKGIAKKFRSVGTEKVERALEKHGMGDVSLEKIADVLSGTDRAGFSAGKMKHVVLALQDVGLASKKEGASRIVLTASRAAEAGSDYVLTPEQVKARMKQLSQERRKEANEEEDGEKEEETTSILDRMRGAVGVANKRDRAKKAEPPTDEPPVKTVRQARDELRQQLQPKIVVPPPKKPDAGKDDVLPFAA